MYQIKVLDSKEFKKASRSDPRYANVNDDTLGFADPAKKTAYVRFSAYPELNKYLIDHEFEHLLEEDGTDEDEFGIRHKKGKKFFKEMFLPSVTSGILSGGQTGGFVNLGRKEGKFDLLGPLGNRPGDKGGIGDLLSGALMGLPFGPAGAAAGAAGNYFLNRSQRRMGAEQGSQIDFEQQRMPQVFGAFNPTGSNVPNQITQNQTSQNQGFGQRLFPGGSGFNTRQPNIQIDPRYREYQYGAPWGRTYFF